MKNITIALIALISIQILTMAQGILSARLLLPTGKGALTAAMLWPTLFASLGVLGIQDAVAFSVAKSNDAEKKRIAASALWMMSIISTCLVGFGYFLLPIILSNKGPELINSSLLYLWYIPPTLLSACLLGILLGRLQLTAVNVLRTTVYLITLIFIVTLYLFKKISVINFTWAFLSASWGVFFLAGIFVIKNGWMSWVPSWNTSKKLLAYGVKVHIGSLAGMFNFRLDQLLLSIFLPSSILGLYVVAVTVGSGANLLASTLAYWVAFPRLSNLPTGILKSQTFGRFMRLAFFSSFFSALILYLFTPWLIHLFFGSAFIESIAIARVLIIAAIPLGCNSIFTSAFKSYDFPNISSRAEIIGLLVTLLSLTLLLPNFHAMGAAWASLLAYSTIFIYMCLNLKKKVRIGIFELFFPRRDDWIYIINLARFCWFFLSSKNDSINSLK